MAGLDNAHGFSNKRFHTDQNVNKKTNKILAVNKVGSKWRFARGSYVKLPARWGKGWMSLSLLTFGRLAPNPWPFFIAVNYRGTWLCKCSGGQGRCSVSDIVDSGLRRKCDLSLYIIGWHVFVTVYPDLKLILARFHPSQELSYENEKRVMTQVSHVKWYIL